MVYPPWQAIRHQPFLHSSAFKRPSSEHLHNICIVICGRCCHILRDLDNTYPRQRQTLLLDLRVGHNFEGNKISISIAASWHWPSDRLLGWALNDSAHAVVTLLQHWSAFILSNQVMTGMTVLIEPVIRLRSGRAGTLETCNTAAHSWLDLLATHHWTGVLNECSYWHFVSRRTSYCAVFLAHKVLTIPLKNSSKDALKPPESRPQKYNTIL